LVRWHGRGGRGLELAGSDQVWPEVVAPRVG
jgi:hypothetical protein